MMDLHPIQGSSNTLAIETRKLNLDLILQVCRQAGYFKHAVYLAEKYDQHDL